MLHSHSSILINIILYLSFLISSSTSQPPPSPISNTFVQTFQYVNSGPLNNYSALGLTYRTITNFLRHDVLTLRLCFYNTTPNAYTLALATERPTHFVWSANPTRPVKDGATLTLRQDGNLVLSDVDGRVVWQTKTSNKGVVSIVARREKSFGNIALVDANNNSVWQSFDYPTDTLFSSQFLRVGGPKKLVSRVSSSGAVYSMVMMPSRLSLYYKAANSSSKPVIYYTLFKTRKTLISLEFYSDYNNKPSFTQSFVDGSNASFEFANLNEEYFNNVMGWFIRLENDGNLKIYVYDVQREGWYMGYKLFTNGDWPEYETQVTDCQLPEKCGNFGVCYGYECPACPTPNEIVPWTSNCETPKLGECSLGKNVTYFKVEGVEHFSTNFTKGEGRMVQSLCETKCSMDCKCLAYFYHKENSKCWLVNDLNTLIGSGNIMHPAYVKMTN